MKVAITTLAYGPHWYPLGIARMIQTFNCVSKCICERDVEIRAWVNCLPPGAPDNVVENGYDYTGYTAKPFALRALSDCDIGLWLDASFYPIKNIQPLI